MTANKSGARSSRSLSITHAFKVIYLISLVLLVNIAYVLSYLLALGELLWRNFEPYVVLIPFISVSTFLLADFLQISRFYRKRGLDTIAQSLQFAILQTLITTTFAYIILPQFEEVNRNALPRSVLLVSCFTIFVLLSIWSFIGMGFTKILYPREPLLIVGGNEKEMDEIAGKIAGDLAHLDLELSARALCKEDSDLTRLLAGYAEILICPGLSDKKKSDIIHYCAKKNIVAYLIPQYYEISLYQSRTITLNDLMLFMIDRLRLSFEQRIVKRLCDIIISFIALVVLCPFLLISAVIIKLTSPGPVLFKQKRMTIHKKPYTILKLRTMEHNAEEKTGPVISGKHDPRVTKFGNFLRRSKLDEAPQFINVLIGDMSVVGPRSERPEFVEQFEKDIPAYTHRFAVKAGITGMAQVFGSYDTSPKDKLRYDLLYIKSFSILQDIKIMFQSIRAIFTPRLYNHTFKENKNDYNGSASK